MKLWLENDNGTMIELKELTDIKAGAEVLFFKTSCRIMDFGKETITDMLESKTGKRCIILDPMFDRVFSL
jgi:hypothetical protein